MQKPLVHFLDYTMSYRVRYHVSKSIWDYLKTHDLMTNVGRFRHAVYTVLIGVHELPLLVSYIILIVQPCYTLNYILLILIVVNKVHSKSLMWKNTV